MWYAKTWPESPKYDWSGRSDVYSVVGVMHFAQNPTRGVLGHAPPETLEILEHSRSVLMPFLVSTGYSTLVFIKAATLKQHNNYMY